MRIARTRRGAQFYASANAREANIQPFLKLFRRRFGAAALIEERDRFLGVMRRFLGD
jgi:hypothetical protein